MENQRIGTFTSQQCFTTQECQQWQNIVVGVPKETMKEEFRVGLTPQACQEFLNNNQKVYVESGAGLRAGFSDEEYIRYGAHIVKTNTDLYAQSQLIVKVLAPQKNEVLMMKPNQVVMAFFNFSQNKEVTEMMRKQQIVCIDYDSIETELGAMPVAQPMSEIAGRLAIQQGMKYLEKQMGGSGVLIGGITGVTPAKVTILGSGIAGVHAARIAASTGANVTMMDINMENLRRVREMLPQNINYMFLSQANLESELVNTDLLIGAVMQRHSYTHRFVVTKKQVQLMKNGSVAVDLGMMTVPNFECSQMTTIEQPTYMFEKVIFYCAANIWSSVPQCASEALSASVLPFALQIANKNWKKASMENVALMNGVSIAETNITNEHISRLFKTDYVQTEQLLQSEVQKSSTKKSVDLIALKQQINDMQSSMNKSRIIIEA